MSGWTLLDRLKHDPRRAHIPVHIISGDENSRRGFALGAMTYLEKAVTQGIAGRGFAHDRALDGEAHKKLLLVCAENEVRHGDDRNLLAATDIEIIDVPTGGEALAVAEAAVSGWHRGSICVLPDIAPLELIEAMQAQARASRAARSSSRQSPAVAEEQIDSVHNCARSSVVRYAPTIERLLDESVLLLHREEAELSREQRAILGAAPANRSDAGGQESFGDRRRRAEHFRAHQRSGSSTT